MDLSTQDFTLNDTPFRIHFHQKGESVTSELEAMESEHHLLAAVINAAWLKAPAELLNSLEFHADVAPGSIHYDDAKGVVNFGLADETGSAPADMFEALTVELALAHLEQVGPEGFAGWKQLSANMRDELTSELESPTGEEE